MSRAAWAGFVAVTAFALSGGQAFGAEVRWFDDLRRGPMVHVDAAPGEGLDLTIRATSGTDFHPDEIVVDSAAGALTTSGTFPAPGACEPEEAECMVPCRIETPQRARCSIYDAFERPPRLTELESPYRSFDNGVWLRPTDAADRVTVPADNPVRLRMRTETTSGPDTWNLSRVEMGLWVGTGDVVTSGPGANVSLAIWGPITFNSVNGRADTAYCYEGADQQTMRIDIHDDVGNCTGDVQRTPVDAGPAPAPPGPEDVGGIVTSEVDQAARVRRCVERNLAQPGSCITP